MDGLTPYEFLYGNQVLLPMEFQLKTFRTVMKLGIDLVDAQQQRVA